MKIFKTSGTPHYAGRWFFSLAAWLVICAWGADSAIGVIGADVIKSQKVLHPDKFAASFDAGQEAVEVIVNLAAPQIPALTRLDSAAVRQKRRSEIAAHQQQVLSSLPAAELGLRHRFENQPAFTAFVTPAGLQALANHPLVESIEPTVTLQPHLAQGIPLMNASAVRAAYNGQGTAIAICDTGIDYTHPMLGGGGFPNAKVIGGYDFGDNDADPMPSSQAHGTACAGIAAGSLATVSSYIGGVAYNAKLYALKITAGTGGSASSADMAAAWDWCVTHQYDDPANPILVISTSFGGDRYFASCNSAYPSMTTAASNAVAAGITLFVSSGNEGYCDSIAWPACIGNVISVGAVYDAAFGTYYPCVTPESCAPKTFSASCPDNYYASDATAADKVTSYSNTASFLGILAPSNRAHTLDIAGGTGYSSGDYDSDFGGTSAASPYAAGAAACIQSAAIQVFGSPLSPTEIRDLMTSTGDDITDTKVAITKPRVNLGNAIGTMHPSLPIAQDMTVSTPINVPVVIALQATDEGLPNPPGELTHTILSLPNHGTLFDTQAGAITTVPYNLSNYGSQLTYTPRPGCTASASFTYAVDDGGTAPDGGQSNPAAVTITITMTQTLYSAAMDSSPDWTFEGQWQWGVPAGSGGSIGNPDPAAGFTGSAVIGYNLQGDYTSKMGTTQWAMTPAIDCSAVSNVTLSFYRWLNVDAFSDDQAWLQVSSDGTTWTTLWQNASPVTDAAWTLQTFDLSAVAEHQPTVYLRWGMGPTSPSKNYSGWNIDDVTIRGQSDPPAPIAGDFEPDCDVDTDDLLYLAGFWLQSCGDCQAADLLADGIINLEDLSILAHSWLTQP